ncbi:hypothetical protein D3C85_1414180 [compost metagenome]
MDQLPLDTLPADVLPTNALNDMLASMAPLIILSLILGLIATVLFIGHMVRVWYVQSATLKMHKDVATIKDLLLKQAQQQPLPQQSPTVEQPATTPEPRDVQPRQDA